MVVDIEELAKLGASEIHARRLNSKEIITSKMCEFFMFPTAGCTAKATWEKHQKLSQEDFYLCQCSMTSLVTEKAIKKNVWQMPESSKYLQRNLVLDNGHLLVQVLKRSGILVKRIVHKELGIMSRTKCFWNSQKADILFSVQRLDCPGVYSRAKDIENCQYIFTADYPTIETIFRIIVSAIQLSLYGAVANICEEF